jgi:hypothetical protein
MISLTTAHQLHFTRPENLKCIISTAHPERVRVGNERRSSPPEAFTLITAALSRKTEQLDKGIYLSTGFITFGLCACVPFSVGVSWPLRLAHGGLSAPINCRPPLPRLNNTHHSSPQTSSEHSRVLL